MKLYLDLCVYNRPFDYQGHDRVALETSIFTYILEKIETGAYILVASDALTYENNKNPDSLKSSRIATYFELAKEFIEISNSDCERHKIRNLDFQILMHCISHLRKGLKQTILLPAMMI